MTVRSLRNVALFSLLMCSFVAWPTSAEENTLGLGSTHDGLTAPFAATVKSSFLYVYLHPELSSPVVGLLRESALVTVTACEPDCATRHAWASIGTDGFVRLDSLAPQPPHIVQPVSLTTLGLWYGRAGKSGITVFKQPRIGAPTFARKRFPREMAFLPNLELRQSGWFERAAGGFVRVRRVNFLTPSPFQGEARPQLPLAFIIRNPRASLNAGAIGLHRYDRIAIQEIDRASVATKRGPLPRNSLRIVTYHRRPMAIPAGAKWVLVDLSQQTLTAYESETAVYATLISSGKDHKESQTHAGLYQVEHKMAFSDMHGEPDDPFEVDRVPYTLFFNKNEALHGAYWHDRFGSPTSHGCINLSPSDAHWLFNWAPPRLPDNWNTIDPKAAGLDSLWVFVKRKSLLENLASKTKAATTGKSRSGNDSKWSRSEETAGP